MEALNYVLEADSDSELSGMPDDIVEEEAEEGAEQLPSAAINEDAEDQVEDADTEFHISDSEIDISNGNLQNKNTEKKTTKPTSRVFRWRSVEPPVVNTVFKRKSLSLPPENFNGVTP